MKKDHDLYERYQKIKQPEYFQRYFMKWYELHQFDIDVIKTLRVKVKIYQSLGISDHEISTYQTIIKRKTMIEFMNGGTIKPDKAESILRQMPTRSEQANSESHYLSNINQNTTDK